MPEKLYEIRSLIVMSAIISKGSRFLPHLFVDVHLTAGE